MAHGTHPTGYTALTTHHAHHGHQPLPARPQSLRAALFFACRQSCGTQTSTDFRKHSQKPTPCPGRAHFDGMPRRSKRVAVKRKAADEQDNGHGSSAASKKRKTSSQEVSEEEEVDCPRCDLQNRATAESCIACGHSLKVIRTNICLEPDLKTMNACHEETKAEATRRQVPANWWEAQSLCCIR